MKTAYEYIYFEKVKDFPKTSVWICRNSNSGKPLGVVKWYGPWRQYCYFTLDQSFYSVGCMADISAFIGELMGERKKVSA